MEPESNISIKSNRTWIGNFLTPQTMLWILAGFVSLVIFWKDSHDNWDKVKELEKIVSEKADKSDLKNLDDKVNRQYQVQRDQNLLEGKQIEEALDWIEFQKGYEQGQEDLKAKK